MPDVRLSSEAVKDLDHMIVSHGLPFDTRDRVRAKLEVLEHFPGSAGNLRGGGTPCGSPSAPGPGC